MPGNFGMIMVGKEDLMFEGNIITKGELTTQPAADQLLI
jgi:hypothetical protein